MKNQKTAIRILCFVAPFIMSFFGNANAQSTATINIGTQTWSTKNLDVSMYRNGDAIPQVQDATQWSKLRTGAWCYYENKTENGTTYGKLYNCYAVNDIRGLAPAGWHVPTINEWATLKNYLLGVESKSWGEPDVSGAIKEAGTTHWKSPNSEATNSSGFTGLPGGSRDADGTFAGDLGRAGWWWASKSFGPPEWYVALFYNDGKFSRSVTDPVNGLSVRCLKD